MKTVRLALAAAIATAVALFAATSPAQAYPITGLTVSGGTVVGGTPIDVTAQVTASQEPDDNCIELSITYQGETVTKANTRTFTHTFDTRVVNETTTDPVTAHCTYETNKSTAGTAVADVQAIDAENTITLLPKQGEKPDEGGLLPNTGGERLAWLVIGGLLVLVGGGVVVASRRRSA